MNNLKTKDHINFYEDTHQYINTETGVIYKSGTSVVSKYYEKFIANKYNTLKTEKKLGITHEEVIELWNNKAKISTDRGTAIHLFIERMLLGEINNETLNLFDEETNNIIKFLKDYKLLSKKKKKYPILHTEDILYDDINEFAGQSDLVLEYKDYLEIMDWKTNEKTIEELTTSYKGKKMLHEFNWLEDTTFNHYVLQLSLYSVFAEKMYNKPVKSITIVHINKEVNAYKVPDFIFDKVKLTFKQILGH